DHPVFLEIQMLPNLLNRRSIGIESLQERKQSTCRRADLELLVFVAGDGTPASSVGQKIRVEENVVQLCGAEPSLPLAFLGDVKHEFRELAIVRPDVPWQRVGGRRGLFSL